MNKELKDMFFSLNLIESYGSGIRRAKDALKNNGSPKLKFYPDNDVDNYTNAIMEINKEFLNIKNTTQETTKETTKEKENIVDKIVALMLENPKITAEEIANNLENISAEGIRYHIRNLKKSGKIRREGSTKSGKWIVKGRENE